MKTIKKRLAGVMKSHPFRRSLLVLGLLVPAALVPLLPQKFFRMNESYAQLHIEDGIVIPVAEVSGMAVRAAQKDNQRIAELFAVGDKDSTLWSAKIEGGTLQTGATFDLKVPMHFSMSECSANSTNFCRHIIEGLTGQWEGLAVDAKGRVWGLQETTESIHVFDPSLTHRDATIFLEPEKATKKGSMASIRPRREKELFEGVLVTSETTFLAAKQTKPPSLIKYELRNPIPNLKHITQVSAKPVGSWRLPAEFASCSLNEISPYKDRYYLVSSSCHVIFEVSLEKSRVVKLNQVFQLPSAIRKPEALVVLSPSRFIVGDDYAEPGKPNLFILRTASRLLAFRESTNRDID